MCFQKYWYRSKVFAWRKNAAPVMEAMAGTGGAVSGTGSMQTLLNDSKEFGPQNRERGCGRQTFKPKNLYYSQ